MSNYLLLLNYCLLLDAKNQPQQHDSGIMSGIFSLRNEGADEFSCAGHAVKPFLTKGDSPNS